MYIDFMIKKTVFILTVITVMSMFTFEILSCRMDDGDSDSSLSDSTPEDTSEPVSTDPDSNDVPENAFEVMSAYGSNSKLEILYDRSFEGEISYIVSETDLSLATKDDFEALDSLITSVSITSDDLLYDDYIEISSLRNSTLYYVYVLNGNTDAIETFSVSTNRSGGYTTETGTVGSGDDEKTYTIYFPADYDAASVKKWPLLVSVKGPAMVTQNPDFPCIVFNVDNSYSDMTRYNAFLAALKEKLKSIIDDESYHIDISRMYTCGYSVGGCWTFDITNADGSSSYEFSKHMSAGTSYWLGYSSHCSNMGAKDVWLTCGETDGYKAYDAFASMESYLDGSVTGDHRLSVFPGLGHVSTPLYNSPVAWKWLLAE